MEIKRVFGVISKLLLIFVIIGFFMPVCCDNTGPELLEDEDTSFFGFLLIAAAVLSLISIFRVKSDSVVLPIVVCVIVSIGLIVADMKIRDEWYCGVMDCLDSGGLMIMYSSIASAVCAIVSIVLKHVGTGQPNHSQSSSGAPAPTNSGSRPQYAGVYPRAATSTQTKPTEPVSTLFSKESCSIIAQWPLFVKSYALKKQEGGSFLLEVVVCTRSSARFKYSEWRVKAFDIIGRMIEGCDSLVLKKEASYTASNEVIISVKSDLVSEAKSFEFTLDYTVDEEDNVVRYESEVITRCDVPPAERIETASSSMRSHYEDLLKKQGLKSFPLYYTSETSDLLLCPFCGAYLNPGDETCYKCGSSRENIDRCRKETFDREFLEWKEEYDREKEREEELARKKREELEKKRQEELKQQALEREKREQERIRKKRRNTAIVFALVFLVFAFFLVKGLVIWNSDKTGHWHPVFGIQVGYSRHDFSLVNETKATCTEDGHLDYVCDTCGYTKTEPQKATGHKSDNGTITVEPTCSVRGTKSFSCMICGAELKTESVPALGHLFDEGVVAKEPTCTAQGYLRYTCLRCGSYKAEIIPTINHSYDETGKCSICGAMIKVGEIGPAGGYVFYDKGYFSDGWRFLEAAPANLRVVNGVPTVDSSVRGYSSADKSYVFGYYRPDNGTNYYSNGTTKFNLANCTSPAIGTGESNTTKLFSLMGEKAHTGHIVEDKTEYYATKLCALLEYSFNGKVFDDWFLPSKDELNQIYLTIREMYPDNFDTSVQYWSSSESETSDKAYNAWLQDFRTGGQDMYGGRYYSGYVRPVRAF